MGYPYFESYLLLINRGNILSVTIIMSAELKRVFLKDLNKSVTKIMSTIITSVSTRTWISNCQSYRIVYRMYVIHHRVECVVPCLSGFDQ